LPPASWGLPGDRESRPSDLTWIQASTAFSWLKILRIKTALGAIVPNRAIKIILTVIDKNGYSTEIIEEGIEYLWPHLIARKSADIHKIEAKRKELFDKGKDLNDLPGALKNLDK
jgi:hypothetical protein